MAKPASVVVSTVLSVVLAVGMIPSSAFAAAGNASASAQAEQQAAPAGQPESNPSADTDAASTQGSASNSNSTSAQADPPQDAEPAANSATPSTQSETAAEQPSPAASTPAIEPQLTADPAQIDALAVPAPQSLVYAHTTSASQNGVTFTVGWNDAPAGQATTFHVTAAGGSGTYKARMDVPTYWDAGTQESVCDPSRGSWTSYASFDDGEAGTDFQFEFTASGTYRMYFYFMNTDNGIYYLRAACDVTVDDVARPSVSQIVNDAVAQCKVETDGSEYAMALCLHDWALDQLEYDRSLNYCSAESGLTRGLGTCESYQRIYAKLLDAAGIANGRIEGNGHTWNAVKIDGEWCQMDLTWDDSDSTYGDLEQRHLYFGLTDELMAIAHSDHAKNYQSEGYAYRSTAPTNDYYVRNGKAKEWAEAYSESIQKHLDAHETEFEIDANNPYDPPSISGIKNGLIAWQMNQMDWNTQDSTVALDAQSEVQMTSSTSWTASYAYTAQYSPRGQSGSNIPNFKYRAHVAWAGWQDPVESGEVAGTVGQSLGMEALEINCGSASGSILVEGYSPAYGWQDWNAKEAGTTGESTALEAVRIKLTGELAERFDIYYQPHIAWVGWAGWAKNGDPAGSMGYARQLEAIRIEIVEKNAEAPGANNDAFMKSEVPDLEYATHLSNIGWTPNKASGQTSGAPSGENGIEAIHATLNPDNAISGTVEMQAHVAWIGWQDWTTNMAGTTGQSLSMEAIRLRLTGNAAERYSIRYRVYVASLGWQAWSKDGEIAGTTGRSLQLEGIQIEIVEK